MAQSDESSRWIWILAGRVVLQSIVGALVMAIVGAISVGAAGALTGWVLDGVLDTIRAGTVFGLVLGGEGAGAVGLIIFGILGGLSNWRRSWWPSRVMLLRLSKAMLAATFAAITSFYVFAAALGGVRGYPFQQALGSCLFFVLFGTPTMTVCGEIAAAVWGFRRDKANRQ